MTTCLAGVLVLTSGSAMAVPPPPPTLSVDAETSVSVSFVIDEIDPESGERIAAELASQLRVILTDAGYHVIEDPRFANNRVRVKIMLTDAIARDYEIGVEVERDCGSEDSAPNVKSVVESMICHACTEARVVEVVMAEGQAIVGEFDARVEEVVTAPTAVVEPEPPVAPPRVKPRGLAHAGIAILSLGVVTAVAGGSLLGVGEYDDFDSSKLSFVYRDFRPTGIALAAIGAVATLTGASLLAVDLSRRRRQSGRLSFRTAPGYAGLHFQARF